MKALQASILIISIFFCFSAFATILEVKKEFYDSGELKTETQYIDGIKNGLERNYNKDGSLQRETTFIDGEKSGIDKLYNENGSLLSVTNYKDNKKDGLERDYYIGENKIMAETTYVDGKKNGTKVLYDLDGTVMIEEKFKNDVRDGITLTYWGGGELGSESLFKEGNLLWINEYYRSGFLERVITFENNKAVSGYLYTEDGKKREMTNAHLHNTNKEIEQFFKNE
ncbi:toxin-antitoxin system YwqK family antitoxin [Desulfopila sp. IMCC35008]|uniref:toxin-antitoxin system YwqK family antitoxin n=1 Tax=Desulfopila sp. IMCC35008 TaxID=2653858 RepID=UPI0013D798A3|nr:hypothetical protein [Desulfopila sp. IMCC35008]